MSSTAVSRTLHVHDRSAVTAQPAYLSHTAAAPSLLNSATRQANQLLLALVLVSCVASVVIGWVVTYATLPLMVGGVIAVLAVIALAWGGTQAWSKFALSLLLCATVALHIQVSLGMLEFHFGVFVSLALVMVYRDWRVVLACALFFAVHHVVFDRLQALGWGIYCTTQPDFAKVALHAAFVVLQTGVEIYVVHHMNQAFRMGSELNDLVQRIDQPGAMELDIQHASVQTRVAQRLQQMFARVHDTVAEVKYSAHVLHAASNQIADGSHELSARTEQARQSVEETASAAHEIQQTVASTVQIAQQAHQMADAVAEDAKQGVQQVQELVANMQTIQRGSDQIAEIVGVVDGLAFQTNLLALNAAVEAARAGEQGRGFAVVAEEVRRLALRSSQAAKDIHKQIDHSVQAVTQGSALSEQVEAVMRGFESRIHEVSARMDDIAQAASQQHDGIALISEAIGQLEQVTAQNALLADRSRETALELQQQAQNMLAQSSLFATRELAHM